jgi:hypothetical protein
MWPTAGFGRAGLCAAARARVAGGKQCPILANIVRRICPSNEPTNTGLPKREAFHRRTNQDLNILNSVYGYPKRRKYSVAVKQRIVEESFQPGASVARVAQAHGVNAKQVFSSVCAGAI